MRAFRIAFAGAVGCVPGAVEAQAGASRTNDRGIAEHHEFQDLKAFGRIVESREIDGKIETDVRIFALSRGLSIKAFMAAARAHWDIEYGLHWSLDVAFREDSARNRKVHGPANLAVLRRRAMDVARADDKPGAIARKLKRARWDHGFLLKFLGYMRSPWSSPGPSA